MKEREAGYENNAKVSDNGGNLRSPFWPEVGAGEEKGLKRGVAKTRET